MDDKDQIIEDLRRELTETRRSLDTKHAAEARRKQDEIALVGSEARFRQVVMFSPNPLFTLDAQGRTVFCNKACEDLVGHPLADLTGKPFAQLFLDSASAERVAEAVAKVFQGVTCPELELTIRHEDGGLRSHFVAGVSNLFSTAQN